MAESSLKDDLTAYPGSPLYTYDEAETMRDLFGDESELMGKDVVSQVCLDRGAVRSA